MMLKSVLLFLVLFVAVANAAKVVSLTAKNFDSIVNDPTKNVFVKYYAPWCGHCVRMAPAYEKLAAEASSDDVIIAEVNADKHKSVSQKAGVRGFPTLKFYSKDNKKGIDYQGARDFGALKAFVDKQAKK